MRAVFLVQGEGRGHMTQALSLQRILEEAGHSVAAVFISENPERPVPDFFRRGVHAPLHTYRSPAFVLDPKQKGVRPYRTVLQSLRSLPAYLRHARHLYRLLEEYRPDVLVNFYDVVGGLYAALHGARVPVVAVGHQFLFFHPKLPLPPDRRLEIQAARLFTRLVGYRARLFLGLSFTPLPPSPDPRLRVVPPLLRQAVLEAVPRRGRHLLTYVLYPGYAEEVERWHTDHPHVELHCFWARTDVPPEVSPRPGLTFHRLDDRKFIELLASCRGFASTAGFESVCEAAYLGKPVLVVPTANHVEQLINALDAERAGIALRRSSFDLSPLLERAEGDSFPQHEDFRRWVQGGPARFVEILEGLASADPSGQP